MILKTCKRKIITAITGLFLVTIIYFFPTNKDTNLKIVMANQSNAYIYLLDNYNYVARVNTYLEEELDNKIKDIISSLTSNSEIKNGFKPLIPDNTKIIDYSLENGLLKINFSKELLNTSLELEEKMIESIVYSLTEIDDIKEIMIFVEGDKLSFLPISKKILPITLDRDYGINKIYDLDNFKDIEKTTIYYLNKYNDYYYYVPVSIYNNDNKEKIEIIIEELKSRTHSNNLLSYMSSNIELESYEIKENDISLSFNEYILDSFNEKNIIEEIKYSILLSIKDNYDINNVVFNVNTEKILDFDLKTLE